MPHSAASDLGLHCLPMSHKKNARLKWVNKSDLKGLHKTDVLKYSDKIYFFSK